MEQFEHERVFVVERSRAACSWTLPSSGDFVVQHAVQPSGKLVIRFLSGGAGDDTYCVGDAKGTSLTIPAAAIASMASFGNVDIALVEDVVVAPTGSVSSRAIRHITATSRSFQFQK